MPRTYVEQVFDRIEQSVDRDPVPNRMRSFTSAADAANAIRDFIQSVSTLDARQQEALLAAFHGEVATLAAVCMLKARLLAAEADRHS